MEQLKIGVIGLGLFKVTIKVEPEESEDFPAAEDRDEYISKLEKKCMAVLGSDLLKNARGLTTKASNKDGNQDV